MKKFKKVLSILLCLVLMAGILPVSALADGGKVAKIGDTEYATLGAAIKAAGSNATIQLLSDVTESIKIEKSLTLDLNGFTLTGDGTDSVVTITGTDTVVAITSTAKNDDNSVKNGIITGGSGSTENGNFFGGGVFIVDSTVTLSNLTVTNNHTSSISNHNPSFIRTGGGGIASAKASLTLNNVTVSDNKVFGVSDGGGIFAIGGTLNISNSTIRDNVAVDEGGGIYAENSVVSIAHSVITDNTAKYGGGIKIQNDPNVLKNTPTYGLGTTTVTLPTEASTISYTEITNNSANQSGSIGGGMYIGSGVDLKISNSSISYNTVTNAGGQGGGIVDYGSGNLEITNNTRVNGNKADFGAGIYIYGVIANNTKLLLGSAEICNNEATSSAGCGGGIYSYCAPVEANAETRIQKNKAVYGGGCYNVGATMNLISSKICNNSASAGADDVLSFTYQGNSAALTVGESVKGETLKDCNHIIDGWYDDSASARWNAHDEANLHIEKYTPVENDATTLYLKAAHGEESEDAPSSIIGALPILWLNMEDHYSYIVGYPDGTVQPNGKITRAEVATIFFRLLSDDTREAFWSSTNSYSDVTADKWYNNAVSTLSRLGVISGYPDGTFRPDASITRAEFAKIAVSFCKYGSTTYSGCFSDVKASDWFSTCVETARNSNLIAGYPDGTFRPNNAITRAEACTIVNRTLGRKPAKNHMAISGRINWPDCVDTEWFYADMMEATNSHDYQMVGLVEDWNRKLPQRDWAALETEWSHAYSAPGGEVGR